ncbi:MAG: ABC transporter ATP-binding protein [Peptostreptococcaceae bacterium]|nr:ABC transporter ATP-binding protein [Peptostreptococcaceae bacterium]
MDRIVEFKNVSKKYGEQTILQNFSLTIHKGDFLSVVGTSGSGKTTIMKMLNGLIVADEGEVLVRGKNILSEDLIALRRKIGYAIQGNGLFPHMTIEENIGYVPKLENRSKSEIREIVENMLSMVGLPPEIKERYPNELSGGQQQRVGIARAYANEPDILLMDEPFGAVDSITRYQLQKDLKEIHRKTNCTVIFITHDIQEAFKLSTHILVLDKGKIQQYGTNEEVRNDPESDFVKKLIDMAN